MGFINRMRKDLQEKSFCPSIKVTRKEYVFRDPIDGEDYFKYTEEKKRYYQNLFGDLVDELNKYKNKN